MTAFAPDRLSISDDAPLSSAKALSVGAGGQAPRKKREAAKREACHLIPSLPAGRR